MRIVFIQSGNFATAHEKLLRGEAETSHSQRYSVNHVNNMVSKAELVSVICTSEETPERDLNTGVNTVGIQFQHGPEGKHRLPELLIPAIAERKPTHVIVRQPAPEIFDWCSDNEVACLPLLADSYGSRFRELRFRWSLRRSFRRSNIHWVANHQIDACRTLTHLGLAEGNIVPWDWPQSEHTSVDFPSKHGPASNQALTICYAGRVEVHKGTGDLIRATKFLVEGGLNIRVSIYGDGEDMQRFKKRISQLGLSDRITMHGRIPVEEVVHRMNEHDIVVVASRHYSNEGMPNTIRQAIRSRSPLVVSDHPAFSSIVKDKKNAVIFRASRPRALARAIKNLSDDQNLFRRLSSVTVDELVNPVADWHEVIDRWLANDVKWLEQHSLAGLNRQESARPSQVTSAAHG